MASFPGSVKSFTTKNSGDVIAASHVTDLQDEVAAIEDGVLNGTARLNSSNSTLATLSVAGGSTLAGTLSVAGGSTFTVRPVMPPPHMALVFLDSTGAVDSSAASTFAYVAEGILTNSSMHSTGTNPERLTPQSTGIYHFTLAAQTVAAPTAASILFLQLVDSSGSIIGVRGMHTSTSAVAMQVTGYKRFDALGGYLTGQFLNSGGGSTHSFSSGVGRCWMSMVKL